MSNLGLGVMIGMLGGNEDTAKALEQCLNKQIGSVRVADNLLMIEFEDGKRLKFWDDGQSCCEHRHMSSDADLSYFAGGTLLKVEITTAPNLPDQYDYHEIQFLDVHTSKGMFQVASHNEHNGYYGGFLIRAALS